MNRSIATAGAGVVLAAALAGCSRPAVPGAGKPSVGPNSAMSVQPGTPHPAGSAGGAGKPAECRIEQLDVSVTGGDAGAGHRSKVIVFRNTGSATCVLQGYPGAAALDGNGR